MSLDTRIMNVESIVKRLDRRLERLEGAERSGVPQGCLPSPTCSAPERSGGVEQVGDYLRRSAPVERSAELKCYIRKVLLAALEGTDPRYGSEHIIRWGLVEKDIMEAIDDAFLEAADSGQRSAPKAESVESDEGASGAQARNDGTMPRR